MQDNFKDYIHDHRQELEHSFDADKSWEDFQQNHKAKRRHWPKWAVAATVSLLLGTMAVWVELNQRSPMAAEEPQQLTEWQEAELYYQNEISEMTHEVKAHTNDEEMLKDLEHMDQAMADIKEDLKDGVANELVIEALMDHYRLKLTILQEMLSQIKEQEENENEKNISTL